MTDLSEIPNLEDSSLELLEAAGFRTLKELAGAEVHALTAELERANAILEIADEAPKHDLVTDWVRFAREVAGVVSGREPASGPAMAAAHEGITVASPLSPTAPFAIPVPGQLLEKQGLLVADIPQAVLVKGHHADLEAEPDHRIPSMRMDAGRKPGIQSVAVHAPPKSEIDFSRLKSIRDVGVSPVRKPGPATEIADDRVALIRAPRLTTNEGVNPSSRRFIRGVLHTHPVRIYVGAILTVLLMLLAPLGVVAATLLLLSSERPDKFSWVPSWWLAFPLALPLLALCWLIWAFSGSCRICGQKLFVHRSHRKNAKAHYLPVLGYVLPLCVHILLFRWFRCTHCGTPVRLKQ